MVLSPALQKAVFIDRDGVLNDLVDRGDKFVIHGQHIRWTAPFTSDEVRLKHGVWDALETIGQKGYLRILVTNQPDVASGNIDPGEFERIMDIFRGLPLDALYACKHLPKAGCACRKPAPGMLLQARDTHGIDMPNSYMIGDLETDVRAGIAAGVRTIRLTDLSHPVTAADHRVTDIMQAAQLIL